ncbi:putative zinc-binding oxidoreductase ToxD [Tothia fuscella]|uniref:Zinc-binding oxidoreductase ToxD n=1 Tax=Tothia fuscella TaxID=1048955 RepID=A0A9P4NM18_9PEZI|nr:putative zinc-binding oxidoreductase ToxD [Tothia fuscella]
MAPPTTMRVLKAQGDGTAKYTDAPIPKLRPDYMLIKTTALAINPTDWKHIGFVKTPNCTIGCDYAGEIIEIGSEVTRPFKKGDHVFGFSHGGNEVYPEDGAFGEYLTVKGDVQLRVPEGLSDVEAASMGVALLTCGQGMYQLMGLPLPTEPTKEMFPILIYGGSGSTGAIAIRLAKLSGLEVITTCSPHNFETVKSLGADAVFDYKEPNVGAKIREHTKNKLYHAFDTISEHSSHLICADALSTDTSSAQKPKYGSILPTKSGRSDVIDTYSLGYTVVGEAFRFGPRKIAAKPEDYEFMRGFMGDVLQPLLDEGKLRPHRIEVKGGLGDVLSGLEDMKAGKVSGCKWVYKVGE